MRVLLIALLSLLLPAASAGAAELSGTLKKIKESGAIALGHREASYPLSFLDEAGQPVGYSVDLCLRIVGAVKDKLGLDDLQVTFVPVTPETRLAALADGRIDIECGSTTNTLSRQEQVDFTYITFVSGAKLLVRKDSGIEDFGGLADKKIALATGTTTDRGVKSVLERTGISAEVMNVTDHDEGFQALKDGRVDAYISDHILLLGLRDKAETPGDFAIVGKFLSYEPYGLMVRRDDSAFRLVANRTLSGLFKSDEITKIYVKWFGPLGLKPGELLRAAVKLQSFPE